MENEAKQLWVRKANHTRRAEACEGGSSALAYSPALYRTKAWRRRNVVPKSGAAGKTLDLGHRTSRNPLSRNHPKQVPTLANRCAGGWIPTNRPRNRRALLSNYPKI